MATKTVRNYFALVAGDYLKGLAPLIEEIVDNPVGFEVDPSKLQPGEDVSHNLIKLEKKVTQILEVLLDNVEQVPL